MVRLLGAELTVMVAVKSKDAKSMHGGSQLPGETAALTPVTLKVGTGVAVKVGVGVKVGVAVLVGVGVVVVDAVPVMVG